MPRATLRGAFLYHKDMEEMTDNATVNEPPIDALNFALWPANTEITLTTVNWDQQFRNGVRFSSRARLNDHIDSLPHKTITNTTYVRTNEPIRLADPFNTLWKYNYIRVRQPAQPTTVGEPDTAKDYYYFITDVQHVAPNTTYLSVALDIFQTWIYDVRLGHCFVQQSHAGIAQSNAFTGDRGRRYLSAPEGLDTGSAYVTINEVEERLMSANSNAIVFATADLLGEFGSPENINIPELGFTRIADVATGIGAWLTIGDPATAVGNLPPWIAQTIIAIVFVPDLTDYYPGYSATEEKRGLATLPSFRNNTPVGGYGARDVTMLDSEWRDEIAEYIGDRYKHLHKFKTFPYSYIELSHTSDNSLMLRPELFDQWGFYLRSEISLHLGDLRLKAHPRRYNGVDVDAQLFVTSGQLPQTGTTNDNAAISLASSARTRAYQSAMNGWGQDKALRSNQTSYDAATRGMEAAQQSQDVAGQFANTQQAQSADWATQDAWRKGATGVAQGAAAGAGAGALLGPAGAVVGGLIGAGGAAVNAGLNLWETDIQNGRNAQLTAQGNANAQSQLDISQGVTGANRDATNKLANWAARGDYQAAEAGILASVQQTESLAPSAGAMPQGSIDAMARRGMAIRARVKTIDKGTAVRIGEYWLRYGYTINEYMPIPSDLMCMENFTYWKMAECNLEYGPMPELYRDAIRGMFEKGITIHRSPESIGRDVENAPILRNYY